MDSIALRRGYLFPFLLIGVGILSAAWWIFHSLLYQQNPDLIATAITFDLVATIPVLYYFLVLRPRQSSLLLLVPCIIICMAIANRLVPPGNQAYLKSLERLSVVLEFIVLVALVLRIRKFSRRYREAKAGSVHFTDALFSTLRETLSDRVIYEVVFLEFFLLYFAFAGWFLKPVAVSPGRQHFTYHRKSGYVGILTGMMMVLVAETVALHVIVQHWSAAAAWVLTILSIYGALWLIGDYHMIRTHPIVLTDETLYLRIGMRWRANIPVQNVSGILLGTPRNSKSPDYLRASVLWPGATLVLKNPVEVEGLFGRRKTVTRIGLSLDDPESLRSALSQTSLGPQLQGLQ